MSVQRDDEVGTGKRRYVGRALKRNGTTELVRNELGCNTDDNGVGAYASLTPLACSASARGCVVQLSFKTINAAR